MRPKVKTSKRKAGKLYDTETQYVSIVDRGANDTPFTLLKSTNSKRNGETTMAIKKRTKVVAKKRSNTVVGAPTPDTKKATQTEMVKMVFSAKVFSSEDEVLAYVKAAEWDNENLAVTLEDNGDYVVREDGMEDDAFLRIDKVATEDAGVDAYVGEREVELAAEPNDTTGEDADEALKLSAEDTDEDAETEDEDEDEAATDAGDKKPAVKKSVKLVVKKAIKKAVKETPKSPRSSFLSSRKEAPKTSLKKFSQWDAQWSDSNTLAGSISGGMEYDATPPGYYDVSGAFDGAVRNILASDNAQGRQVMLTKVAAEFADIIGSLDSYFQTVITAPTAAAKSVEGYDQIRKWADGFADFINDETVNEAPTTTEGTVEEVAPTSIQDIIKKALEPIQSTIKDVTDTVETLSARQQSKKSFAPEHTDEPKTDLEKSGDVDDDVTWLQKRQQNSLF